MSDTPTGDVVDPEKTDVVERLDLYASGYVDFHIHEIVPEAGGGWSLTDDISAFPRGGAQQYYPDGIGLTEDEEVALLDALERLNAKGRGFVVVSVPCGYESDWYESNGGVQQLVSSGGPYLNFDKARLVGEDEIDVVSAAKVEIIRLRSLSSPEAATKMEWVLCDACGGSGEIIRRDPNARDPSDEHTEICGACDGTGRDCVAGPAAPTTVSEAVAVERAVLRKIANIEGESDPAVMWPWAQEEARAAIRSRGPASETQGGEATVVLPVSLVKEVWSAIKNGRDHAAMEARKTDDLNALLKRMKAGGMADWIPTLEEVQAAGPYVRVGWDETIEEASARSALSSSPTAEDLVHSNAKETKRKGVYIASKTKHAARWRNLRDIDGVPVISTWIDEAGPGESSDLNDLWSRCLSESTSCEILIVYREPDDVLKGGWVEVGAALAAGIPVFATRQFQCRSQSIRCRDMTKGAARKIRDSDGVEVVAGHTITFSYGLPGVGVTALVVARDGKLIALTPGHNPKECKVSELKRHVGDFYVKKSVVSGAEGKGG